MYTDASQIRKKIAEVETEIETTVIFTQKLIRCSKAISISGKIIITKAKLQAISDAIAMCSEKALKNSEQSNDFAKTKCKEQRQCEIIQ